MTPQHLCRISLQNKIHKIFVTGILFVCLFFLLNVHSRHCIQSQFDKLASAQVLYASRDGRLSTATSASLPRQENVDWRRRRQTVVPVPQSDGVLLKFPQVTTFIMQPLPWCSFLISTSAWYWNLHAFSKTEITFTPQEPLEGRYVPLVHYHQLEHASFPVDVRVAAGREWKGESFGGCARILLCWIPPYFQL